MQQEGRPTVGGRGTGRSLPAEGEEKGSMGGTGQKRWAGRQRLQQGEPRRNRRPLGRWAWRGEGEEGRVGCSTLGWSRADH